MKVGYPQQALTIVYGDNLGALTIAENLHYHKRTKHFDIKHHYICEIKNQTIKLKYCPSAQMTADMFTKPLPKQAFEIHRKNLGVSTT